MDRGIWAIWYDLAEDSRSEFIDWLHNTHLPAMLHRPGYLWAANVENVVSEEREARNYARLVHTEDPAVPGGYGYVLMFGAESPHTFVNPSAAEMSATFDATERSMLSRPLNARSSIWVEADRVEGPDAAARAPGITPGPVVQFGSFNANTPENETEVSTWYARSRLPLVQPLAGSVGARKLVSVSGWAKHAILYEFSSLAAAEANLVDTSDWSRKVVNNLVHAPHSPTLGVRIWPPASS